MERSRIHSSCFYRRTFLFKVCRVRSHSTLAEVRQALGVRQFSFIFLVGRCDPLYYFLVLLLQIVLLGFLDVESFPQRQVKITSHGHCPGISYLRTLFSFVETTCQSDTTVCPSHPLPPQRRKHLELQLWRLATEQNFPRPGQQEMLRGSLLEISLRARFVQWFLFHSIQINPEDIGAARFVDMTPFSIEIPTDTFFHFQPWRLIYFPFSLFYVI